MRKEQKACQRLTSGTQARTPHKPKAMRASRLLQHASPLLPPLGRAFTLKLVGFRVHPNNTCRDTPCWRALQAPCGEKAAHALAREA